MAVKLQHHDLGPRGSKFTAVHPPLKNGVLFILLLFITLIMAFTLGLHLLDQNVLAATCLILVISLILKLFSKVHSESILLLPSLGVQVETQYYLGHSDCHFIHLSHIHDIIINEAVTMHSIVHYLVVLLKDEGQQGVHSLYPLFSHSWPSLNDLKSVYRAAQRKLIQHSATTR